jgi:hypothetical protein
MTREPDVLERAKEALRGAYTGERQGSGFTRARIMASLYRDRRRRLLRWIVLSPMASLLIVGSAWAHNTGRWPVIWQAVASVLSSVGIDSPRSTETKTRRAPAEQASPPGAALPDSAPLEMIPPASLPPEVTPPPEPSAEPPPRDEPGRSRARPVRARQGRGRPDSPRRALERAPVQPPAENEAHHEEGERDPEVALFRRAHDLHVSGRDPRAAITAYDEYLAAFPHGRFVPEAHYNAALDHIKLGDKARARQVLEPFARGVYGEYRRKEAEELIDALR